MSYWSSSCQGEIMSGISGLYGDLEAISSNNNSTSNNPLANPSGWVPSVDLHSTIPSFQTNVKLASYYHRLPIRELTRCSFSWFCSQPRFWTTLSSMMLRVLLPFAMSFLGCFKSLQIQLRYQRIYKHYAKCFPPLSFSFSLIDHYRIIVFWFLDPSICLALLWRAISELCKFL